jgi:hypothetical protein
MHDSYYPFLKTDDIKMTKGTKNLEFTSNKTKETVKLVISINKLDRKLTNFGMEMSLIFKTNNNNGYEFCEECKLQGKDTESQKITEEQIKEEGYYNDSGDNLNYHVGCCENRCQYFECYSSE